MGRPTFEVSRLDGGPGLRVTGDLDLHSAGELTAALAAFQDAEEVWLDMTEVTFIDSSGLRSILSFARSRNEHGRIVIVDPTSVVGPVFNMIGLHDRASIEVVGEPSG